MKKCIGVLFFLLAFSVVSSSLACIDTTCFTSGTGPADLIALHEAPAFDSPILMHFYAGAGFNTGEHKDGWIYVTMPEVPFYAQLFCAGELT